MGSVFFGFLFTGAQWSSANRRRQLEGGGEGEAYYKKKKKKKKSLSITDPGGRPGDSVRLPFFHTLWEPQVKSGLSGRIPGRTLIS